MSAMASWAITFWGSRVADTRESLESLYVMIRAQREDLKEKLASGLTDERHFEIVGRCKGLGWTMEKIREQIKHINGGNDDENPPRPRK
jgi:hypothetical protein